MHSHISNNLHGVTYRKLLLARVSQSSGDRPQCFVVNGGLTLWPWSWTFTVKHTIYVKCEYFMNQEG